MAFKERLPDEAYATPYRARKNLHAPLLASERPSAQREMVGTGPQPKRLSATMPISRRFGILLCCTLGAMACDKPIETRAVGPAHIETRRGDCDYGPAVCYACGLNLSGKFECSFGFWHSCPGHQDIAVRITPTETKYESGRLSYQDSEEIIERRGCQ